MSACVHLYVCACVPTNAGKQCMYERMHACMHECMRARTNFLCLPSFLQYRRFRLFTATCLRCLVYCLYTEDIDVCMLFTLICVYIVYSTGVCCLLYVCVLFIFMYRHVCWLLPTMHIVCRNIHTFIRCNMHTLTIYNTPHVLFTV